MPPWVAPFPWGPIQANGPGGRAGPIHPFQEETSGARECDTGALGAYTLGTTALVHEAYLKLVNQRRIVADDRARFFAIASRAMRHILCNYARDRQAKKRGRAFEFTELDSSVNVAFDRPASDDGSAERLLALDSALARLEEVHPRRSRVVECRFFGGMTVEDTAAALGISPRTVKPCRAQVPSVPTRG